MFGDQFVNGGKIQILDLAAFQVMKLVQVIRQLHDLPLIVGLTDDRNHGSQQANGLFMLIAYPAP